MRTEEKTAVQVLREGWEWCVRNRDAGVFNRQKLNFESRYCLWANQTLDGRKWRASKGKEIFPWEGASDARVPLVDLYVREDAAALLTAWRRMGTQVFGVEVNDEGFSNRLKSLLKWQKYTQMAEAVNEVRLWASYGLERGAAMMKVFWAEEREMGYVTIDLEELTSQAIQAPPEVAQEVQSLLEMIRNPETEGEAAALLQAALGEKLAGAKPAAMKKLVRDLRTSGQGQVAVPQVVTNRPRLKALLLNEEVFLPPEATEVGNEVYERELIDETTLREREGTLGWNGAWVEEMLERGRGMISTDLGLAAYAIRQRMSGTVAGSLTTSRLFEIVHAYRRVANEDGVPEVRYTCFNPHLLEQEGRRGRKGRKGEMEIDADNVAYDGPLGYQGIKLDEVFVLWERDKHARLVDEARGYGEELATMQNQIKVEWDSRADRASMATLPPLEHPPGHEPERWGPGVRVPVRKRGDTGFADIPKFDLGSKDLELTVRGFADQMRGRPRPDGLVTAEGTALKQDLTDTFLEKCGKVDATILKLDQQFMPDSFYYRVVGTKSAPAIHTTRDEIQGSFDVIVGYNVEMMDPNTKKERLSLMEQALQMDVNGIVDRDAAIGIAFEMIDPNLGERLLRPGEEASQREIADEMNVFAQMNAGIPVDVKPGQAYELRLQTLGQILQRSPIAQQKFQSDENFRKLVETRAQQLQFQLQQRKNALIGRIGAESGFDQFKE